MTFCADLDQQPCEMMDALGNVTKVVEDQLGREVQRVAPWGTSLGRLNEVQDARGGKTKYGYDSNSDFA